MAINLGEPSDGLVVIDLDCPEALVAATHFLPKTALIFGRESAPRGHWAYRVPECGSQKKFTSLEDGVLVEYRANGSCCLFPPSVYENGESAVFQSDGEPHSNSRDDLLRATAHVAAAALLAKHWNGGGRHDLSLPLAGALANGGWERAAAENFMAAVCKAGGDEETARRLENVRTSFDQYQSGQPVTGIPTLEHGLGPDITRRVCEWLGIGSARPSIGHNGPPVDEAESLEQTEIGNAGRFVRQHGADVKYCNELGSWFVWRAGRWEQDKSHRVKELADQTVRSIYAEASTKADSRDREELIKWASRSCSQHGVEPAQLQPATETEW